MLSIFVDVSAHTRSLRSASMLCFAPRKGHGIHTSTHLHWFECAASLHHELGGPPSVLIDLDCIPSTYPRDSRARPSGVFGTSKTLRLFGCIWWCDDTSIAQAGLLPGPDSSEDRGVGAGIPAPALSLCPTPRGISYPASRPGGALCGARASVGDLIRSTCSFHTDRPENTVSSVAPPSFDGFAMAGTASVRPTPPPRAPSAVRSSVRPVRTTPTCPLWVRLGRVRRGPRIVRRVPSVRTNPVEFGRRRVVVNQGVA